MSAKSRNSQEAQVTRTRAERLLIDLEKLKAEISGIESKYGVLSTHYTAICEDAISRISALREELDDTHVHPGDKQDELKKRAQNLEARFRLGLISQETYLSQKEGLILRQPPSKGMQLVIDKAADGIEFGLDKLGDGLIFPIVLIARTCDIIKKQALKQL